MEKIELLEERVYSAVETIQMLKEKSLQLQMQYKNLLQENEFLHSENKQVRKLMAELDQLREERRVVRQKCEHLMNNFDKANL